MIPIGKSPNHSSNHAQMAPHLGIFWWTFRGFTDGWYRAIAKPLGVLLSGRAILTPLLVAAVRKRAPNNREVQQSYFAGSGPWGRPRARAQFISMMTDVAVDCRSSMSFLVVSTVSSIVVVGGWLLVVGCRSLVASSSQVSTRTRLWDKGPANFQSFQYFHYFLKILKTFQIPILDWYFH